MKVPDWRESFRGSGAGGVPRGDARGQRRALGTVTALSPVELITWLDGHFSLYCCVIFSRASWFLAECPSHRDTFTMATDNARSRCEPWDVPMDVTQPSFSLVCCVLFGSLLSLPDTFVAVCLFSCDSLCFPSTLPRFLSHCYPFPSIQPSLQLSTLPALHPIGVGRGGTVPHPS